MTERTPIHRLQVATELQQFIDQLQVGFAQAHDELQQTYFSGLGVTSPAPGQSAA